MDMGDAYRGECQPLINHPDPLLARIVGNVTSPRCAAFRFKVNSYTCTSQHQEVSVSEKLNTEDVLGRLSEPLPSVDDFISILRLCRNSKNLTCAERVHVLMCENGLQDHAALVNYLAPVLLKCGSKSKALDVFNRAVERNEHSWTSLIQDSVESGLLQDALDLYQQMTGDSVTPSKYTVVALLQACNGLKCLELGYELHAQAAKYGFFTEDVYVRSSLVDFYGKCGSLMEARVLIDKQPVRDLVSYTALMAGYVEHGVGDEALECFEQMRSEGMSPNAVTFVCSLKASVILGSIERGQQIHTEIVKKGCDGNLFIGSSLVDLYAKCGLLLDAQEVFDELLDQDVVCWTALIAGYVEHGFGEEALHCLEKMELDGVAQNAVTFMFGLKACSAIGAIGRLRELHIDIAKAGCEHHLVVANTLVDTYAKWGSLADAWTVFNKLLVKDLASWNALILGYSEQGLGEEAFVCFQNMKAEGMYQDVVTFVNSLKACGSMGGIDAGRELHLEIVKEGFETILCVGCALLDMYMKCEFFEEAGEVFRFLPARDVVSWTALIEGYAELELHEKALNCMKQMQQEGVAPNSFTYASGLKACKGIGLNSNGQELHAGVVKLGLDNDVVVCNSLVDMYASLGLFLEAEAVLDKLPLPDDISWNALMGGYGEYGLNDDVLDCFEFIQQEGFTLNAATSVLALKACGSLGVIGKGQEIHTELIKERLEKDPFVSSSLVDMYSKCGFLGEALEVFSELPDQDVVAWTALISGLAGVGFGREALAFLENMQLAGVPPEPATYVCCLKACGNLKALDRGRRLHVDIVKEELESDTFVGSSLIDMYAKCDLMSHAQEVFNDLLIKDVVSWTTLLAGYSKQGLAKEALACFEQMKLSVPPNAVTFICSLRACGSIEAIDTGHGIYSEVVAKGLEANISVANYMVEMYAKCGSLAEAHDVLHELPTRDVVLWTTLIAGYTEQGLGEEALKCLEEMKSDGVSPDAFSFVCGLKACSSIKALDRGRELHAEISDKEFKKDHVVASAIVDMYAKCG
eukprot:c24231_g4_i1 orf=1-3099(-)